jgi:hypothetical protein
MKWEERKPSVWIYICICQLNCVKNNLFGRLNFLMKTNCKTLVNAVMKLRAPQNAVKFSSICRTGDPLKRVQLH